jgi:hypothetical protein
VLLEPGDRRPLPELPVAPAEDAALARVLAGESQHELDKKGDATRLTVPLRVAGQVQGALIFGAESPAILTELHADRARRLADIVAAHLELLRRSALPPAPELKPIERAAPRRVRALPATPPLRESA